MVVLRSLRVVRAWSRSRGVAGAIACVTAGKLLVQPCVALVLVAGLVYSGVLVAPPMLLLVILMQAVHLKPSPGSNTPAP